MTEIAGFAEAPFEGVRTAFETNFERYGEIGASFSLYHRGREVVSLVGGHLDATRQEPYTADHLQMVFSTTKGATAICAHMLVQDGRLDLDAPVAQYWPEFAAKGKENIPVAWLLCHKAGLADVDRPMTLTDALDLEEVVTALAESEPMWEPGTQHGYHAVTYGWLVGEMIRRVTGQTVGQFFAEQVAAPLGLEFWIGLPDAELPRVAPLIPLSVPEGMHFGDPDAPAPGLVEMLGMLLGPDNLIGRALSAPGGAMSDQDHWNDPRVWQAEFPAANGITNGSSLARLYAATVSEVDGVRLLDHDTLRRAVERQTTGNDAVLMFEIPFALGFMLNGPLSPLGSETSFGHYGAGGSVGFGDHAAEIGFGYAMNKMDLGIAGDPRTKGLIDAVYAALS